MKQWQLQMTWTNIIVSSYCAIYDEPSWRWHFSQLNQVKTHSNQSPTTIDTICHIHFDYGSDTWVLFSTILFIGREVLIFRWRKIQWLWTRFWTAWKIADMSRPRLAKRRLALRTVRWLLHALTVKFFCQPTTPLWDYNSLKVCCLQECSTCSHNEAYHWPLDIDSWPLTQEHYQ